MNKQKLDPKVIEFVVGSHEAIRRAIGSPEKSFKVLIEPGDDAEFHLDVIRQVAKLNKVRAVFDYDDADPVVEVFLMGVVNE